LANNILTGLKGKNMVRKFRTIEHTADIGLIAWGDNLGEAFLNAGKGMSSIIVDLRTVAAAEKININIEEMDLENLLFSWLNRLIFYFDTDGFLFRRFEMVSFSNNRLSVSCFGEWYDPERHTVKTGVKSATFYKLLVDKENKRVQVFLDV
jgi:SHS2 domain-containing protein